MKTFLSAVKVCWWTVEQSGTWLEANMYAGRQKLLRDVASRLNGLSWTNLA
jgi:hypothetical protein